MHIYSKVELEALIEGKLRRNFGRTVSEATQTHMFKACAMVVRDIMSEHQMETSKRNYDTDAREVHYLSLEFLMGRSLEKNAYNLGILDTLKAAISDMGFDPGELFESEPDAGLGNGGLGRLAACYLDSMSTLEIPATGYSICYHLGIFKQKIVDGAQVELSDDWLDKGDAWLITKTDETELVNFGGHVVDYWEDGFHHVSLEDCNTVMAVPRDMEIAGYKTDHTNVLRLWDAKSPVPVNMNFYSTGEYLKAVEEQTMAEVIAKVLYPADNHYEGKSLRLKQQYFFVSATVQSIVHKHFAKYGTLHNFHEKHVIQINDTHPSWVIPELMRILMDEYEFGWDEAWYITTHSVAYTNHTILAEALEHWPQNLVESLLPRIFQIICEINERYLAELRVAFNNDTNKLYEMAIVWNGDVRMANLCVASCFAVNGVSALHSEILTKDVFHDAWLRTPEKFQNVTNGVDHRRWLAEVNPSLNDLIIQVNGSDNYLLHPEDLADFEAGKDDPEVLDRLGEIKQENKVRFANHMKKQYGIQLNTDAIFDVQSKRLHEYKRQLLNVMHIIYLYQQLQDNPNMEFQPRTFLFAAKAAPSYTMAKRIIELINSLSKQINNDPICKDKLQVFFLENYSVSLAEIMIPAAEVSEQISTAGKEASGTGNMKFMMNGALTIGTEDGANVEMHKKLGDDNIFIFGLNSDEVQDKLPTYNSYEYMMNNPALKRVIDAIAAGFSDKKAYNDISNSLIFGNGGKADQYMLLADFASYVKRHDDVVEAYKDKDSWNTKSLINIARSGSFAADRAVRDYADKIWKVPYRE